MRFLLMAILLVVICACQIPAADAADPFAAAQARHAWTWFGLDLDEARERAAAAGLQLLVDEPLGSHHPDDNKLVVLVHQGRVLHARSTGPDGQLLAEGCTQPDMLPWLGLSAEDAATEAALAGRPLRVIGRDGQHLPVTMDYLEDRLNAILVAGVVVALSGG